MIQEYQLTCNNVNKSLCLIKYKLSCNLISMKYGERIKVARKFAKLTQPQLAEKLNGLLGQQGISYLENSDATGSEFTVHIAIACGVRPEWLAMEEGEMTDGLYVSDERLKHALLIMQALPDYAVDKAIKEIDSLAEFVQHATQAATTKK